MPHQPPVWALPGRSSLVAVRVEVHACHLGCAASPQALPPGCWRTSPAVSLQAGRWVHRQAATQRRQVPAVCSSNGATPGNGAMPGSSIVGAQPASEATYDFRSRDIGQWRKLQLGRIARFAGPALSIPLAGTRPDSLSDLCSPWQSGPLTCCSAVHCRPHHESGGHSLRGAGEALLQPASDHD